MKHEICYTFCSTYMFVFVVHRGSQNDAEIHRNARIFSITSISLFSFWKCSYLESCGETAFIRTVSPSRMLFKVASRQVGWRVDSGRRCAWQYKQNATKTFLPQLNQHCVRGFYFKSSESPDWWSRKNLGSVPKSLCLLCNYTLTGTQDNCVCPRVVWQVQELNHPFSN